MAIPSNWNTVEIRALVIGTDDQPIDGNLIFIPRATRIIDAAQLAIVIQREYVVRLNALGQATINLPATDDPDVTPIHWTYEVIEDWKGGSTYDISVPIIYVDSGLDLAAISPVSPNFGIGETIEREEFDELAMQVEALLASITGGVPDSSYLGSLDGGSP